MALPKKMLPAPSLCFISLPLTVLTVPVPGASLPEWEFQETGVSIYPQISGSSPHPCTGNRSFLISNRAMCIEFFFFFLSIYCWICAHYWKFRKKLSPTIITAYFFARAFPGGTVAKNLPANAGDTGDASSIPGSGRSPGGGNDNPLQYSILAWKISWTEELGGLQSQGHKELDMIEYRQWQVPMISSIKKCRGVME